MKAFNIFLKVCNIQFFKTFFLIKIYILHLSDFDQIFGLNFYSSLLKQAFHARVEEVLLIISFVVSIQTLTL